MALGSEGLGFHCQVPSVPAVQWWAVTAMELLLEQFWNSELLAALFLAVSNPPVSPSFSELLYSPC